MPLKKDIVWRVALVYFGVLLFAIFIIAKVIYIQFVEGSTWIEKAKTLTLKNITIQPNRGDILAHDGKLLASSVPYYEIRMDLKSKALLNEVFSKNIDSLAFCLSNLFLHKSKNAYKKELQEARKRGERYYLIKRKVNYTQLKKLKQFPIFRLGRYKGGFIYKQENERIQPHINLASRTIGYLNKGMSGNIVGIEGAYDHYLKGVVGIRLKRKLSGNVWIPVNDKNEVEPKDGKDVITTIDVNIQDVAENALLNQLKKHNAHHGTAVLMEVETGEIKAIVNLEKDKNGNYKELYNYAIGESTEPGSTLKIAALIVALEDGYFDLDDTIDTGDGVIYYYDKKLSDTKKGGYGKITVQQAFEISSNVGVSKIITQYYKGREHEFINRLYSMNLNEKLGVEIKGEGAPDIKYPNDKLWSGISLPMMSIGYEIRLTPLQILTFYNAIANNGRMVKPKFVKAIQFHGEIIETFDTELINPSICSFSTIRKVKKVLEGVVENGTAKNLKNTNYKIAGKSGTAQIANEKYGYKNEFKVSYQASFVGYFPADKPKYSCIVVVNSPSNSVYYGNLVAGPVFKEIADKVYAANLDIHEEFIAQEKNFVDLPYSKNGHKNELDIILNNLGIERQINNVNSEWVITTKRDTFIEYTQLNIKENLVPNVKEMGVKDALFLLENAGLEVEVKGRGKIKSQSILPGTRIKKGDKIIIEMSFI